MRHEHLHVGHRELAEESEPSPSGRRTKSERSTVTADPAAVRLGETDPDSAEAVIASAVKRACLRTVQVQSMYETPFQERGAVLLRRLHLKLLDRGGRVRMIFPCGLLTDASAVAQLVELSRSGAEIRLLPYPLPAAAVVDAELAVMGGAGAGDAELVASRHRDVARALSEMHRAVWDGAVDLATARQTWLYDQDAFHVLRMLCDGYTDEHAARSLGLSLRTYRRRVAALMCRMGANSRFAAGVRAAHLGMVAPGTPPGAVSDPPP
ncbi:hypothetical protein ACFO3J_28520 [Streptomyces polygonati]|uniref:HTH luxR-type domain-containing protein n=1 Tax=Streptomyces polygonati TaxID=1617087 RepID=A0ABV8HTK9_9ACTN